MTPHGWLQLGLYLALLTALGPPLGRFIAGVLDGRPAPWAKLTDPLERLLYRVAGVDPARETGWKPYATGVLLFNLFGLLAVTGHKGHRIGDVHILADTHVAHLHALFVFAGDHAHKGDTVAVLRIHVCLDLEHEAGERIVGRLNLSLGRVARPGGRRQRGKGIQKWPDAEVRQRAAEKYRGQLPGEKPVSIKRGACACQ